MCNRLKILVYDVTYSFLFYAVFISNYHISFLIVSTAPFFLTEVREEIKEKEEEQQEPKPKDNGDEEKKDDDGEEPQGSEA